MNLRSAVEREPQHISDTRAGEEPLPMPGIGHMLVCGIPGVEAAAHLTDMASADDDRRR